MNIKWIKAVMVVVVTQLTLTTQYEISVCAVCEALDLNIQDVGGSSFKACEPDLCLKSGKMELFLRETRSMIGNSTLNVIKDDPSFLELALHDSDAMRQMLVYSFLGRHLAEQQGVKDVTMSTVFLYEYDVQRQTLVLRRPLCAYQRQVYTTLLVLTTVILLAGVALRAREKTLEAEHADTTPSAPPHNSNDAMGSYSQAPQWRMPIGSSVRYRTLPQNA